MKLHYIRFLAMLALAALVGCTALPISLRGGLQGTQADGVSTPTPDLGFETVYTPTPSTASPGQTEPSPATGTTLRLWVPPAFDPAGTSQQSKLMKDRLDQFTSENPEVKLELRVKDLEGAGGMLESLVTANVAAPLTLPDLVLLPRPLLESATLKGLLSPYDAMTDVMDTESWYEYAHQLARVQSGTYCIPFAGDTILLAYHPSMRETSPASLEDTLALGEVFLFPATDPQAAFTLNTYLADGGTLQDDQGRPVVDETVLTSVLDNYQRLTQAGVMPYWLTQFSTDEQVWESFLSTPYPAVATWASSYLKHLQAGEGDLAVAPLPTLDGSRFSLASGWCWALAGQNADKQVLAAKLSEYLVDEKFMGALTSAAGYLPPRKDALQSWPDVELRQVMDTISSSAQLLPPVDLLASIGPALEQAVVDILKAQTDPQTAAETAVRQINQP